MQLIYNCCCYYYRSTTTTTNTSVQLLQIYNYYHNYYYYWSPVLGLTRADGRICNSCTQQQYNCCYYYYRSTTTTTTTTEVWCCGWLVLMEDFHSSNTTTTTAATTTEKYYNHYKLLLSSVDARLPVLGLVADKWRLCHCGRWYGMLAHHPGVKMAETAANKWRHCVWQICQRRLLDQRTLHPTTVLPRRKTRIRYQWTSPPADRDSDPQHARTSLSPGLPRSLELAHSPSLPCLSGTDCCYTFVPSSQSTVLKPRWSLSSSPLTAPNWYVLRHCMISVWQVISHCVDGRPCNDLSVVLRRVRNCRRIIIIIIVA